MEVMAEKAEKRRKCTHFANSPRFNAMFLSTDYQAVMKNLQVFSAQNISH